MDMNLKRFVLSGWTLSCYMVTILYSQPTTITQLQLFPSSPQILKKIETGTGWHGTAPAIENGDSPQSLPRILTDPTFLKECGFRTLWRQGFSRGPTTAASVAILEFGDTSGAYSLFSVQTDQQIRAEQIGDQSFSSPDGLWLWQANLVVHISNKNQLRKPHPTLMELGKLVSKLIGQRAEVPNLVKQLPSHNRIPGSSRYFLGPKSFQRLDLPVHVANLGFDIGAEISSAEYQVSNKRARLLLISYPTPQMARRFYDKLQDSRQVLKSPSPTDRVYTKRTGPLLALLLHLDDDAAAKDILDSILYSASLTWDQVPPQEEVAGYLRTIVRGIMLTGALLLLTLGAGVAFGIIRLTVKRWVPIQIFDRPQDISIIQLQLNVPPYRPAGKN